MQSVRTKHIVTFVRQGGGHVIFGSKSCFLLHSLGHKLNSTSCVLSERTFTFDLIRGYMQYQSIPGYTIVEMLTTGHFGHVFRVRGESETSDSILKLVHEEVVQSKLRGMGSSVNVLDEFRIVAMCRHQHIIETNVSFRLGPFLCMEFEDAVGGDAMAFILRFGVMENTIAKTFFMEMSNALVHVHEKKIAHRDVKLENIFMSSRSLPLIHFQLGDFGLARRALEYAGCTTFCGTEHYIAPEIFKSRRSLRSYGQQVDIWSLGISLLVALTGEHPYDEGDLCEQVQTGRIIWPSNLNSLWLRALRAMCEPDDMTRALAHEIHARAISISEHM